MRGPEHYDLNLEDLSSSISIIGSMLEQHGDEVNNPPPVIFAAVALLRQTQRHFTDLHYFIEDKLGELLVTVPRSGPFYFDRIMTNQPKFLDVKIVPNKAHVAEDQEVYRDLEIERLKAKCKTLEEINAKMAKINKTLTAPGYTGEAANNGLAQVTREVLENLSDIAEVTIHER